jgi:DDE superfamily endonuclease
MSGLVNRNDYCQFLLVSQTNYTLTYFAKHSQRFSHDAPTRYLKRDRIQPNQIWQQSKQEIVISPNGYLIFDDSVLDKNHSREIALVHRQYSGNEHRVIRGIGLVNCVYFNPELEEFWVIDYRIYDPSNDGKDKHEHVTDMLHACFEKFAREELAFKAVLMDTWYATTKLMLEIHRAGILFYCPIKPNRTVSEIRVDQKYAYQQAETLVWTSEELDLGKQVHLKEFPAGLELKLFRVAISTEGTELIVTNDRSSLDSEAVRFSLGFRWKVEQFHREVKQVTGIESCECRSARAQRNHVGCALLVWVFLKRHARACFSTVYAVKQGLLDAYMRRELQNPSIKYTA